MNGCTHGMGSYRNREWRMENRKSWSSSGALSGYAARFTFYPLSSFLFPLFTLLFLVPLIVRAAPPDNDNFATRIALYGPSVTTPGSNAGATKELGEPDPAFMTARSVWWTWTAPADGSLTVSTAGSSFDTIVSIFTGDTLSNLTLVAFNDIETNTSLVTFNVLEGTAYQIAVDSALSGSGNISLQLSLGPTDAPPPNDNFANRITLSRTHLRNVAGYDLGATNAAGQPFHVDEGGGKAVWWTWTAPFSGGMTLTTQGSTLDTLLAVYTGDSVSTLVFVAGNDEDPLSTAGLQSRVTCNVISNVTYQIAVDGFDDDQGDIR